MKPIIREREVTAEGIQVRETALENVAVDDLWIMRTFNTTLDIKYAYNFVADAGTFNWLVCQASWSAMLSDRRSLQSFTAWNNDNNVMQVNFKLPKNYIAGRNVTARLSFTYLDASGWVIDWTGGMTRNATKYDWDASTEYKNNTFTASVTTDRDRKTHDFEFNWANFVAWDEVSFILYRDTSNGGVDTLGSTVYVNQVELLS